MALVLMRAGLGLDLETVSAYGLALPAFAILPSLMESVIGAAFGSYLFGMPFLLAWVMSFICSAVGPAIVASGCSAVKERGFQPAAANFLMTCAVFDDTTCIIGFNCLLHAIVTVSGNVGWQFAIGPMNLVLGLFGGVVAALVLACTSFFAGPGARTWTIFVVCMMLIFVAEKHQLLGAGAIANLVCGLGTRHMWRKGFPGPMLSPAHRDDPQYAHTMLKETLGGLYRVWNIVFYPLLFGLIGASLNVRKVDPTIGKLALAYAVFAVAVRFLVALIVTRLPPFKRFSPRERVFMALTWISKATTQAAFATQPLVLLTQWMDENPGTLWHGHTHAQLVAFGTAIQWSCVLSIFLGAPLGTLAMNNMANTLLEKLPPPEEEEGV